MPKKFTLHVAIGLLVMVFVFAFCQWVRVKLSMAKNSETQLDIMMKRQILESPAFKNSLQHYESNICVQYASEEEYMAIIRLKEQQRQEMKARLERERYDHQKRLQLQTIAEHSNEESSHDSLLMQSLMPEDHNRSRASSRTASEKARKEKKEKKRGRDRGSRSSKKVPKEGPTNSLTSASNTSHSMSFDRDGGQNTSGASAESARVLATAAGSAPTPEVACLVHAQRKATSAGCY